MQRFLSEGRPFPYLEIDHDFWPVLLRPTPITYRFQKSILVWLIQHVECCSDRYVVSRKPLS